MSTGNGTSRERLANGLVAALVVVLAALGWRGAAATGPLVGFDSEAHVAYAQVLAGEKRLPTESQTYEHTTPPAYAALAAGVQAVANASGLEGIADAATGAPAVVAWLAAALAAVALVVRSRRGEAGWAAGAVLGGLCAVAAVVAAVGVSASVKWSGGQFLSILWLAGLVVGAYLLAREVWPEHPLVAALAAGVTAAITVVLRMGAMFHPEMQFAFLVVAALVLVVRASRAGWSPGLGLATGGILGLAALTRQSAIAPILVLGLTALLAGRRRALPFLGAVAVALLIVAGWWWVRQGLEYGNPFQSNLDRYILEQGQPRAFYISAPVGDLVLRPYRPHFAGELWPQFHADLWADWFGAQHAFWDRAPAGATRVFQSTQSVLGLLGTLLGVAGLLAFGGAALGRIVGRTSRGARDVALAACVLLAVLSWIAFVVQLVRFPQGGGDPVKASYLLYLAPAFAIGGVLAARWLWARSRGWRYALLALAALYCASYAGYLVTAYP
jgi:hypothetical protein